MVAAPPQTQQAQPSNASHLPTLVAVKAWRQGNEKGAEVLYARFSGLVRTIVSDRLNARYRRRVGVEDAMQVVFAEIFKRLRNSTEEFADVSNLKGLISKIARQRTISLVEFHERAKRSVRRDSGEDVQHNVAAKPNKDAAIQQFRLEQRLHEAISELPDNEAQLCKLIWFSEKTQKEIASDRAVSAKTIQRQKASILSKLRASMN